jgi:LacI family transcriptional regulator
VAWHDARPEGIAALLGKHTPVAGCVVECSDDNGSLPPRLFGRVPVVYLHASPSLYGSRATRVDVDNDAVVRFAFRELSAGRPAAYGVVGDARGFFWSRERGRAFRALAVAAGTPCRVFPHGRDMNMRASRLAKWIASLPRRTAVFAANDFAAADVVAAAQLAHRAIPGELTLCGVDNLVEICENSSPSITSIQLDFEREGYVAARMVGDYLATKNTKEHKGIVDSVFFVAEKPAALSPLLAIRRESTRGGGRREANILAAVELIRREACNGLAAGEVIARSPGSKSLFNLRFREAMGHSVHDEIEHVRFEKVFTLLTQTDTPIGAIAALCGYRSNIALHKAFRLRTGISMSDWRRQNGNTAPD